MIDKLTMISLSDIHLGNDRVPAEFIIDNLNKLIPDNKTLADVDIIWLAGDIFDQILLFPDDAVGNIELWIVRLLKLCKKWDICLRVLEGTPSHDRTQSKFFTLANQSYNINADVKYIDTLAIEYIDKFDIHVLYVPDEYHASHEETWHEVQDLLITNGLEKVDYAIMHGMFEHQLPFSIKMTTHKSQNYLDIVRKYIFIGHVHLMSVYDRILAQGSTDRLSHNEEDPKGMFRVVSHRDGFDSDRIEFVINEGAKIFKTISWIGLENEAIIILMRQICDIPHGSFIRIELEKNSTVTGLFNSFKKDFPEFQWSMLLAKDNNNHDVSVRLTTFQPIPINANTIDSIVLERLNYLNVDPERREAVMSLLQKIK